MTWASALSVLWGTGCGRPSTTGADNSQRPASFILNISESGGAIGVNSMKKLILFFFIVAASVACSSAQTYVDYQSAQSRILDIVTSGYVKPKVVDLVMIKTPNSNEDFRMVDSIFYTKAQVKAMNSDEANIRANASFHFCEKYQADVIVGALYDIHTTANHDGYIVKVIGYPARFHNFRDVDEKEDKWWINIHVHDIVTDNEKTKALVK